MNHFVIKSKNKVLSLRYLQSVHIRPWKTISQHNVASGRNMKKSKYCVRTKYFDWKQILLGSNISSGHNLQIVPWRNNTPWRNIFHGRKWSDCLVIVKNIKIKCYICLENQDMETIFFTKRNKTKFLSFYKVIIWDTFFWMTLYFISLLQFMSAIS